MKVGEIVIAFENVVQDFAAKDFLSMQDWDSKIVTDETEYHTYCEDCTLIKADSLFDGAREWYYTIEQADYEGADGEYGTWNAFQFLFMENGKVILLTFYRKELKDLKIDPYVEILKSIRPV